ncbi:hypothetical protein K502DRAFT_323321 [Neoconidiobolus thromboides FSU 785]|nr:hypothetical protein K502DRAFT_323321 [Neoconidiobolus thromboides FSU 785]
MNTYTTQRQTFNSPIISPNRYNNYEYRQHHSRQSMSSHYETSPSYHYTNETKAVSGLPNHGFNDFNHHCRSVRLPSLRELLRSPRIDNTHIVPTPVNYNDIRARKMSETNLKPYDSSYHNYPRESSFLRTDPVLYKHGVRSNYMDNFYSPYNRGPDSLSDNNYLQGPDGHKKRPRKKHHEVNRVFRCDYLGCDKSYGALNHLNTHIYTHHDKKRKRKAEEFHHITRFLS